MPLQWVYNKDSILFLLIYLFGLVEYEELAVTQNQNLLIWTQSQYDIWRCLMPLVTEMEKSKLHTYAELETLKTAQYLMQGIL